jgi:hypothetical protein
MSHYNHHDEKMKAVRWEGEIESVSVKEIPIPKILKPLDAIVRVTSAAICGKLHSRGFLEQSQGQIDSTE